MPAWSTEIASTFVKEGSRSRRWFDQITLQRLVYIAHGWCLAISGEPLTGDRPEAWDNGPMYRRVAEALKSYGRGPVRNVVDVSLSLASTECGFEEISAEMKVLELDVIQRVFKNYALLSPAQLSVLTNGDEAPWARVFKGGTGRYREISHSLITDQSVQFAQRISQDHDHSRPD